MPVVGSLVEISRIEDAADFEWRIPASNIEVLERGYMLWSPPLSFAGRGLELRLRKMHLSSSSSPLEFALYQFRASSSTAPLVRYWLGAVKVDWGREEEEIGRGSGSSSVYHPWLPLPELRRRMEQLSSVTLSFVVRLRSGPETDNEMKILSEHEEPTSSLEPAAKKFKKTEFKDVQILQEHLKQLLHSADDHDVLIIVKDKEFRAHKSMLRARSPVFQAMFEHKMKENEENTVTIEDIDPDCFGVFLAYVYTGEVENISAANAIALYYAADKYIFPALKRRCVDVLKSSLSTSLVCDVITLAATHEEEELLEDAMAFFVEHPEEVMETVEWQRFHRGNPIRADKMFLAALRRCRTSVIRN